MFAVFFVSVPLSSSTIIISTAGVNVEIFNKSMAEILLHVAQIIIRNSFGFKHTRSYQSTRHDFVMKLNINYGQPAQPVIHVFIHPFIHSFVFFCISTPPRSPPQPFMPFPCAPLQVENINSVQNYTPFAYHNTCTRRIAQSE